jgi:hypothetical protein
MSYQFFGDGMSLSLCPASERGAPQHCQRNT